MPTPKTKKPTPAKRAKPVKRPQKAAGTRSAKGKGATAGQAVNAPEKARKAHSAVLEGDRKEVRAEIDAVVVVVEQASDAEARRDAGLLDRGKALLARCLRAAAPGKEPKISYGRAFLLNLRHPEFVVLFFLNLFVFGLLGYNILA